MELPLVNDDTMIDGENEYLSEEMSPSESESESEEDVKLAEPSKKAVNNRDALLDKLGDISWPENVEWIHKLSIDIDQEQEVDVNDDLALNLLRNGGSRGNRVGLLTMVQIRLWTSRTEKCSSGQRRKDMECLRVTDQEVRQSKPLERERSQRKEMLRIQ